MTKLTRPEWLLDIPATEYHAAARRGEYLTSSMLAAFLRSPAEFRAMETGEKAPPSGKCLELGTAAHKMILEGKEAYDSEYFVFATPKGENGEPLSKATKAYKEARAKAESEAAGRTIISEEDDSLCRAMLDRVIAHPLALSLLEGGFAETSIRAELCGIKCQARPDFLNPFVGDYGAIVDLKTISNIRRFYARGKGGTPYGACIDLSYCNKLAFYRSIIRKVSGASPDVYFLVVDTEVPHAVGVWKVSEDVLNLCEERNNIAIEELTACRSSNIWQTGFEELRVIDAI